MGTVGRTKEDAAPGCRGARLRGDRGYVSDVPPDQLSCPTLPQLCELAGDFDQLREVAREQADPLSYVAAILKTIPRD